MSQVLMNKPSPYSGGVIALFEGGSLQPNLRVPLSHYVLPEGGREVLAFSRVRVGVFNTDENFLGTRISKTVKHDITFHSLSSVTFYVVFSILQQRNN